MKISMIKERISGEGENDKKKIPVNRISYVFWLLCFKELFDRMNHTCGNSQCECKMKKMIEDSDV